MNSSDLLREGTYGVQLLMAVVVGFLLGYNRQKEHKHAGIRTYSLVCMGATLLTVVSKDFYAHLLITSATVIPSQIAASIITSIGFLGAGVIFHNQNQVSGITTASGLWVTAAIGITIGFGFYVLASIATILAFMLIAIFWRVSDYVEAKGTPLPTQEVLILQSEPIPRKTTRKKISNDK